MSPRAAAVFASILVPWVGACGGGGSGGLATDSGGTGASPASTATVFARSQVLGLATVQSISYLAATPPAQPVVRTSAAGSLLPLGSTALTAEYVPPALSGVRVACVSGDGSSIGVLESVDPGVLSVSAAVLMTDAWIELDAASAWAAAAGQGQRWDGWENCGVKPEGPPYKSSTVTPAVDGSYAEDVVIGNPATNFTTLRLAISSADAGEMLQAGHVTTEDPLRVLRITWRAFADVAGHRVWVERGEAAAGGARGFITLFVPEGS